MTERVVLISGSFAPREGGAERQMRRVLAGLAEEGYDCHVVTQRLNGLPHRQTVEGVSVHRVGSLFAFSAHARLGMAFFLVSAALKGLSLRPDRIISLQLGAASAAATFVSRVLAVPQTVRLTGGGSAAFRSEAFARHSSWGGRLLTKWVVDRGTTILVAPARHLISDFEECFPGFRARSEVLANGVDLADRPPSVGGRSGVLWYSRRGSEQSTKMFESLARRCPDVTFRVMGADPGEGLPRNVEWLGWVDSPMKEMWASSVVLNTSKYEGSPNTVLQALAAGCHVVGRDNRGLREVREQYGDAVQLWSGVGLDSAVLALRAALEREEMPPAQVVSAGEAQHKWRSLLTTGLVR